MGKGCPPPPHPTRWSGERHELPSGVWGEAPADFDFGAFCYLNMASDGNDINKFPIFNQPCSIFCDLFQSNVQHICQWGNVGRTFLKFQFDNLVVAKFTAGGAYNAGGTCQQCFWCSMRTRKCVHMTCTCQLCI